MSAIRFRLNVLWLVASIAIGVTQPVVARAAEPGQQAFSAPEDAGKALIAAIKSSDDKAVLAVLGVSSKAWINSGDALADQAARKRFVSSYEGRNSIEMRTPDMAIVVTGDDAFPFPVPIVRSSDGKWTFDAALGKQEIIDRRIGRNERLTIQTLLAIGDAQVDFAARASVTGGAATYAQRFVSTKGKQDGLFWPATVSEQVSPLGPLFAAAAKDGYRPGDKATGAPSDPYNGYKYRILFSQGANATDGAYSYIVGGRMIGGYAVIAWPVKYGVSGIKTFMMNHEQIVYEADLGPETEGRASAIVSYNPDKLWSQSDTK